MKEKTFIALGNAFIPGHQLSKIKYAFKGFGFDGDSCKYTRVFKIKPYNNHVYIEFMTEASLTEIEIKKVIKQIKTAVSEQNGEVFISIYYLTPGLGSVKSENEEIEEEIENLQNSLKAYTVGLKALREEINLKIAQLAERTHNCREDVSTLARFVSHRTGRNRDMIYRLYELLGIEKLTPCSDCIELNEKEEKEMQKLILDNPLKKLLKGVKNEDN